MRRNPLQRILVASDGERRSDTALRVADLLGRRDGAHVEIVSVYTPRLQLPKLDDAGRLCCEGRDRRAAAMLFSKVWHQARSRLRLPWPIHFRIGVAAPVIAELAHEWGADLIVTGRAPYCEARAPRTYTTERLAMASDVPMLALPQQPADALPKVALVAIDESAAASRAVAIVRTLLDRKGQVHQASRATSPELLALCDALGVDILAVPLVGDTSTIRTLMGGQVAEVLAQARCAVLVAPSPAVETSEPDERPAPSVCTYETGRGLELVRHVAAGAHPFVPPVG